MASLKDTLTEIADIGCQIAKLSERSKELRMSLMAYHKSLPKSYQSATVAQVVVGNRMYQIKPVTKLEEIGTGSKLIDVMVTFDEVFLATDEDLA